MQRLFFPLWPDEYVRDQVMTVMTQCPATLGRPVPENMRAAVDVLAGGAEMNQSRFGHVTYFEENRRNGYDCVAIFCET